MQKRTRRAAGGIVAAVAAAAANGPAQAELLYEFTFHATVTQKWGENPDHPWGGVELGDPAYFKYVIDVEQEDQSGVDGIGRYDLTDAEISYGGIAVRPGFLSIFEVNLFQPTGDDLVKVVAREVWTDNFTFDVAIFELRGFDVLPNDSIPIDFDVLDFTVARSIGYGDGTIAFRALIDSYTYQIVPAPGAALGLLLGACFRTGRRRNA